MTCGNGGVVTCGNGKGFRRGATRAGAAFVLAFVLHRVAHFRIMCRLFRTVWRISASCAHSLVILCRRSCST